MSPEELLCRIVGPPWRVRFFKPGTRSAGDPAVEHVQARRSEWQWWPEGK